MQEERGQRGGPAAARGGGRLEFEKSRKGKSWAQSEPKAAMPTGVAALVGPRLPRQAEWLSRTHRTVRPELPAGASR